MDDPTRRHDLEELYRARQGAKTIKEKEHYEKIAHTISQASSEDIRDREKLVYATRNGSGKDVRAISERIDKRKLDKTNGRNF